MDVALIGEGTYPHQFGGVSVWCDQLVRGMPDYDFSLVALVATGNEPVRWSIPDNVTSVTTMPLWGPPPSGPTSRWPGRRKLRSVPCPALGELIEILLAPPGEHLIRFGEVLREVFEFAQTENLSAALSSEAAVELLAEAWQDWNLDATEAAPTLHDAVMYMQLLEHSLRPLSHPPVRADVAHAVTNGLGALPAFAAKWRYGTPMIVTEHGIYMREQYLHSRGGPFRWPVRALHLRLLRRLCSLGYHEAEMITPGNVYNKRWEEQLGADMSRVRTVYNGVDPADFPASEGEPDVPTISWAGRVDPIKDLETLLLAFALVHQKMPEAKLRMFGSPPPGQEAYLQVGLLARRWRAEHAQLRLGHLLVHQRERQQQRLQVLDRVDPARPRDRRHVRLALAGREVGRVHAVVDGAHPGHVRAELFLPALVVDVARRDHLGLVVAERAEAPQQPQV